MRQLLVETIMEGGNMSLAECRKHLAGTANHPTVKAMISLIEKRISMAREDSEEEGLDNVRRAESCGAASYLRSLRTEINDMLYVVEEKATES